MTDRPRILGLLHRRRARVELIAHGPPGSLPCLTLAREAEEWRGVMSSTAGEIGRFTSAELRTFANRCLRTAWLMDHPGECPIENYG